MYHIFRFKTDIVRRSVAIPEGDFIPNLPQSFLHSASVIGLIIPSFTIVFSSPLSSVSTTVKKYPDPKGVTS